MSRTKDLKTNPENNLSLFDLFSLFCPDRKTKYTETLLRIMKMTPNLDDHAKEVRDALVSEFNIDRELLKEYSSIQLALFYRCIESMFNFEDLRKFQKFCEYNERGLISQNDVSKYNDFEQINSAVSVAEITADSKDLERQVKVIFEDSEWLLVRPLTYQSSRKYGSNTKWCTTTENNPEYFIKYSSKGVLIYCMNKITGYKVASFYSLDKRDPEFSFWNQKDSRIDSLDSELPTSLRELISTESKGKGAQPNRTLLSEEEKLKEEKLLAKYRLDYKSYEIPVDTTAIGRVGYLNRALTRMEEEVADETEHVQEEPLQQIQRYTGNSNIGSYLDTSNLVDIMRSLDLNMDNEEFISRLNDDSPSSAE